MSILILFAGAALAVVSALVAATTLRLSSFVSFVLASYLVCWAEVVALTGVLSLFRGVSSGGYLGAEVVALLAVTALWLRAGRPRPARPPTLDRRAFLAHPIVAGLACVVALAVLYEAVVGLSTPGANVDELWYHLPRAAAWLRHGGLYQISGGGAAQNDYPPNAEIGVLYGLVFLHRDTFATVPQLAAELAIAVTIFGLARRLGSSRAAGVFASLLFLTLSEVALEAMTALNDLVVASFVGAAAYFVVVRKSRADLGLSGLAFGLALGTKYTAFFALPALALLGVTTLPRRRLAELLAWTVAGSLAVGSYGYAQNLVHSRTLLGAGAQEVGSATAAITARGTISTIARNLYRFGDLPGYRIKTRWLKPVESLGRHAFRALHIPTAPPESSTGGSPFTFEINVGSSPGGTWYGPLGWLLVIPISLTFAIGRALGKAGRLAGVLALCLPLYLLVTALAYRYTSQGRFFITPIALTLPLAAATYRQRRAAAALAAIGAVTLLFALAYDREKPTGLSGTMSIWGLSRPEAQAVSFDSDAVRLFRAVDRLPDEENIGVDAPQLYFGYALYGPKLERSLLPLPLNRPLVDAARKGIRIAYLGPGIAPGPTRGWKAESFGDDGTLFIRR